MTIHEDEISPESVPIKIAFAEDESIIRKSMVRILESHPMITVVQECKNGSELVDYVRNNLVDVIVTDMRMPKMGGIAATQLIKSENPNARIITYSNQVEQVFKDEAYLSGASAFLPKHAHPNELINHIERIHRGEPLQERDKMIASIRKKSVNIDFYPDQLSDEELAIICLREQGNSPCQLDCNYCQKKTAP